MEEKKKESIVCIGTPATHAANQEKKTPKHQRKNKQIKNTRHAWRRQHVSRRSSTTTFQLAQR